MGASLAFHLASCAPGYIRRLVAGGGCPPGTKPPPPPGYKSRVATDQGAVAFYKAAIEHWRSAGVELSERSKEDLRAFDFKAVSARLACHKVEAYGPEAKRHLCRIACPSLLVVGSEDPYYKTISTSYSLMSNCSYKVVPGESHLGTLVERDAIVAELESFLVDG